MPRDRRAVIGTAIWNEPSIRALPYAQQHAYFFAYTQPDLNKCGVIAYRPRRWAKFAADLSERHLRRQYDALHGTRHVVLDEHYDEMLVRTYVGHDGLLSQPLIVVAMVREFHTISSPAIRLEVLRELRRLWELDTTSDAERRGILLVLGADPSDIGIAAGRASMQQRIRDGMGNGLRSDITLAIDRGDLNPWPDDPTDTFADALGKGYGKGSTQTLSERDGARSPAPTPTPAPTPMPTPTPRATEAAAPDAHHTPSDDGQKMEHPDPDELVATHVPRLPRVVRHKLVEATSTLVDDGLSEITIAAALELWALRPGAGPGLLPYLAADVVLDDLQPKKPALHVNGTAPTWCGNCDETSRWTQGDRGWYRCPHCHPAATPNDSTPQLAASGPNDPPF